ncbi:serine/threonine-protein kinase [Nocardia salmonicida]|uniref:serine/threonine-protein kinase n=1 Tax=Nocardia salmonicida TaxID=53431 RepID=UPI0007A52CF6|nr:serine/threonine-protein kinase [Nocardia salmonicida]
MTQRWLVVEQLGEGSIGVVYGAINAETGEPAAIKEVMLIPGAERELLARFPAQARNVIPVVEHVERSGSLLMRMPRAECSLRAHLRDGRAVMSTSQASALLVDLVSGVGELGDLLHRDIKPENVLRYRDRWCLSDFGIARIVGASTATYTWKRAALNAYAAPERWYDAEFTRAGDIYSVGVILYEAVSGTRPFPGPSIAEFNIQHTRWPVPPLPTTVDPGLAALVEQMLDKDPLRRPGGDAILAGVGELRGDENHRRW